MCGKTFPNSYILKVHKKIYEGKECFECGLCPQSSISQHHLTSHTWTRSLSSALQCTRT